VTRFAIERLSGQFDRTAFACGADTLDRYLKTQASQDVRRHFASCFVVFDQTTEAIAAYYTLAAARLDPTEIPAELVQRLPRYAQIPAALIGRLAVDRRYQGQGLGRVMIVDAVGRALQSDTAAFAIVVDAKDAAAIAFYRRLQFEPIAGNPNSLFLPVSFFAKLKGPT
jgi:ribosomal protein S18 acetylase RimI-like enzyme